MSNISTAKNAFNLVVTSSGALQTLCPAVVDTFVDITALFLANSSASATLVTISDGTNVYEYEVGANSSVVLDVANLQATNKNTAWTLQCGTSVSSLYASGNHSYRK